MPLVFILGHFIRLDQLLYTWVCAYFTYKYVQNSSKSKLLFHCFCSTAEFCLSLCPISFWVLRLLNPCVHPWLLIHPWIMRLPNVTVNLTYDLSNQNVFSFHDHICTEINILLFLLHTYMATCKYLYKALWSFLQSLSYIYKVILADTFIQTAY